MERRLVSGAFRGLAVRGRDVFVAEREPPEAHHEETPGRIFAVEEHGALREVARSDDPWITDLYATDTTLLWTSLYYRTAAAWRREVFALDLTGPSAEMRRLVPVMSMREGVLPDGRGGAVISMASCLAWLPRGAKEIVPILELGDDVVGETDSLLSYINGCVAYGNFVYWTRSGDSLPPSCLCRVPITGGRVEILHTAKRGDIRLRGANAEGVLLIDEHEGLGLWRWDGTFEAVEGELARWDRVTARLHGGNLWLHEESSRDESCLRVLRAGSRTLESLPFEALAFEITDYGIYRLTHGGVYVTPWE